MIQQTLVLSSITYSMSMSLVRLRISHHRMIVTMGVYIYMGMTTATTPCAIQRCRTRHLSLSLSLSLFNLESLHLPFFLSARISTENLEGHAGGQVCMIAAIKSQFLFSVERLPEYQELLNGRGRVRVNGKKQEMLRSACCSIIVITQKLRLQSMP
jgi:hypothetical protein